MLLLFSFLIFYIDHILAKATGKTGFLYLNPHLLSGWIKYDYIVIITISGLLFILGYILSDIPNYFVLLWKKRKKLLNTAETALEASKDFLNPNKKSKYSAIKELIISVLTPRYLAMMGAANHLLHRIICAGIHDYIQIGNLHFNISDILIILGVIFIISGRINSFKYNTNKDNLKKA